MVNDKFKKFYEIIMIFLALAVVTILIVEYTVDLGQSAEKILSLIDSVILIIFTLDYFIRLYLSKNKLNFIKTNKADLIAIIPFSSVFRMFRLARLARLARISNINRLVRVGLWLGRFREGLGRFFKTNGFAYMVILTILMVIGGAVGIYFFEDMDILDGVWWSFVTTTTVGYGDISPESIGGRLVAGFLMLVGIGFIGMLTGTIATFFLGGGTKPTTYKNQTIEGIKEKLDDFDSLSNDDLEDIFSVLKSLKRKENKK